ncbi:MAG: GNAT family N-acetyltransferase [Candidatus Thermoplasmatota archaeon]|nr:GNAT family N-acetyltransferase [Candidatus Thermoplasmatota archaeon]
MRKKTEYQDIEIKMVAEWPEKEIIDLYKAGGWWKKSDNKINIQKLIQGSYAFFVAITPCDGKAVGMGRLLSDGISDAYIQDLVVLPNYRGYGIGKCLVKKLVDFCLSRKILWIGLISEPGQSPFYTPIGFHSLKDYVPMKYDQKKE